MKAKTGILLVNLGTPLSPSTADVRKYLREFLFDRRVIDIPAWKRYLLVNLIIAPFRSPLSASQYKEIWTDAGSPLLIHSQNLKAKLQDSLGSNYIVELGMRYQQPSLKSALNKLLSSGEVNRLQIVPLYPHYASSSIGSTIEKIMELLKKREVTLPVNFTGPFFAHPLFIEAFAKLWTSKKNLLEYDYYLFSYHGLPERHILKASAEKKMDCSLSVCCDTITSKNYFCYRASCYHTTRLLADALQLKPGTYSSSFQSRLGKDPWIKPYTDAVIKEKAKEGFKRILVFSPAFVADCLETLYEVKVEYNRMFKEYGGEGLHLAESLNDSDIWVDALEKIIFPNT